MKFRKKIVLSPMLSFIVLSAVTIILSGILSVLHIQTDYQTVNPVTNELVTNVVEVESLFSLSGLKYIVTNAVSDFVSFVPLLRDLFHVSLFRLLEVRCNHV